MKKIFLVCLTTVVIINTIIIIGHFTKRSSNEIISSILVTEGIRIVNDKGKVVMSIGTDNLGGNIIIFGNDSLPKISLLIDDSGGTISVLDNKSSINASMYVSKKGGFFTAFGKEDIGISMLGVSDNGGILIMKDEDSTIKTVSPD